MARSGIRACRRAMPVLALLGCSEPGPGSAAGGPGPGDAGDADGGDAPCPPGCVAGSDGRCLQVGIPSCANELLSEDGECRPSVDDCPPGTIPKLDEGCVAVGIPDCAPEFSVDGECRLSSASCPAGSFPVPQKGCVPIDGPAGCGSGTWGNIADGPDTIWVDAAHSGQSDGSRQQPARTLAEALALAPSGGRVALAAGDYDGPVRVTLPVEIVGRCPSRVTLSGAQPTTYYDLSSIVWIEGVDGVKISGVTIRGGGIGVLALDSTLAVEGVRVQESTSVGIVSSGRSARADLSGVLVEATKPDPGTGRLGRGVVAELGSRTTLADSALVGNRDFAVMADEAPTKVVVRDCLIEKTLPALSSDESGRGVSVHRGADVTVESTALVDNHETALFAASNSTLTMRGCRVQGTRPRPSDDRLGRGVSLQGGATGTLESNLITSNHDSGISVILAEVTATGNLVRDTLPEASSGLGGRGVSVEDGGSATLSSNVLLSNHEIGVLVSGTDAFAEVTGNLVEGTLPLPDRDEAGLGIVVNEGARATLSSNAVVKSHTAGVFVADTGTSATLSEMLVTGTAAQPSDGRFGMGVICDGAECRIDRSRVADNRVAAVFVYQGAAEVSASLLEAVTAGTVTVANPSATYDDVGDGLLAASGSAVTVTNSVLRSCARAGLLFEATSGVVSGVASRQNRFGVVLQGSPKPDVSSPDNSFSENSEGAVVADGSLPVPDSGYELPH